MKLSTPIVAVLTVPLLIGAACVRQAGQADSAVSDTPAPVRYSFSIVNTYPHDPRAFTQGLLYRDGVLYESTGQHGASSLRKVQLETGEVLQQVDVDRAYFAEGLASWQDRLIQLTWQSNIGFVYDIDTFDQTGTFSYTGEGWGLTSDGTRLVLSDGSSTLRFLNPETLTENGRLTVRERGLSVNNLNELEFVDGELLANIWMSDDVVVIDLETGAVTARIDFSPLRRELGDARVDVLNGIAWDADGNRLFVTGKYWPKLFEVRLNR
jgi:glutamine cyclotransferase